LLANRAIPGSGSLLQSFGKSSVELNIIENPEFGIGAICQSSRNVIISGFGGHIDISGSRSLLYSLAKTISTYR